MNTVKHPIQCPGLTWLCYSNWMCSNCRSRWMSNRRSSCTAPLRLAIGIWSSIPRTVGLGQTSLPWVAFDSVRIFRPACSVAVDCTESCWWTPPLGWWSVEIVFRWHLAAVVWERAKSILFIRRSTGNYCVSNIYNVSSSRKVRIKLIWLMWQNVMDGNSSSGMYAWFDSIEICVGLLTWRSQKVNIRSVAFSIPNAQTSTQMSLGRATKNVWRDLKVCRWTMNGSSTDLVQLFPFESTKYWNPCIVEMPAYSMKVDLTARKKHPILLTCFTTHAMVARWTLKAFHSFRSIYSSFVSRLDNEWLNKIVQFRMIYFRFISESNNF